MGLGCQASLHSSLRGGALLGLLPALFTRPCAVALQPHYPSCCFSGQKGPFWLASWRSRGVMGNQISALHNQTSCDSLHNPASMYKSRRHIRLCFSIGINNSLHYVRKETAELSSKLLSLTVMERKLLEFLALPFQISV